MIYKREQLVQTVQELRNNSTKGAPSRPLLGTEEFIPGRDGNVRTLVYRPENQQGLVPVVFDIHGGGFVFRSANDDDHICNEICNEVGALVITIDYRLAPEFPYPAAVNDVYDVIKYVADNADKYGIDTERMAICGHSAGANLATVTCMKAKVNGDFKFKCQVLDYPPMDLYTKSKDKFLANGMKFDDRAELFNACYCTEEQARDPYVSPIFAAKEQLTELPPAIILTGEYDMLRTEAEKYATLLVDAGLEVTIRRFKGAIHGFTMFPNDMCEAGHKMIVDGIKKYL